MYPNLLFVHKERENDKEVNAEYKRIYDFIERPLDEHIEDFTLETMLQYEASLLNSILNAVNEIVLITYNAHPESTQYIEVEDDRDSYSVLYRTPYYGMIENGKQYINKMYYYHHNYMILKKSYITYFNLIFLPFVQRIRYASIFGIELDNTLKNHNEFSRNSRYSPYTIPQLYNYIGDNKGNNSVLDEYKRFLTISKYVSRQSFCLTSFMTIFKEMIGTISKLDSMQDDTYHQLNKFNLYLSFDDSIYYFPFILVELEMMLTSLPVDVDENLPSLTALNIQRRTDINNNIKPKLIYDNHPSISLFLPIIYVIQFIRTLSDVYGQSKTPPTAETNNIIKFYKNRIDNAYEKIFLSYKINAAKTKDKITELAINISTTTTISYDYELHELVLVERDTIIKIIEYIINNRSQDGLLYRMNTGSEKFSFLTKLYKNAYIPYLLKVIMKTKKLESLPLSIPMANLFS
jgi:hypothetical protein